MTQENEHVKLKKRSKAEIYLELCEERLQAAIKKNYQEMEGIDAQLDRVREQLTHEDDEEINRILKEHAEN